jgi:predicted MPP superfamily phosphohydrolase
MTLHHHIRWREFAFDDEIIGRVRRLSLRSMPKSASRISNSRLRITRRRVLCSFALAAAGAGVWARFFEPHWLQVVHRTLHVPNLPRHLVGKRLIQLSDFHIGRTDSNYLARVLQRANDLQPDMLALTGDFINHDAPGAVDEVGRLMSLLQPTPLGTFACLGNHDYGHAWKQTKVADRVAAMVRSTGITLLRNQKIEVCASTRKPALQGPVSADEPSAPTLQIVGLDDLWSPRYNPAEILSTINAARPAICLCHNPDMCDHDVWQNFRGVILSGHTHGGQCKPPFLPPPLLPVFNRKYVAGEYIIDANKSLYINRGVGHTLAVRFNCRPEITVFTLAEKVAGA